jgi:DNA-binding response OmpR family regulator
MWDMWRVLVLEDDFLQGEHVCDLLLGEGMEPLGPVATAEAAVELLDTTTMDAAILDIRLQNGLCFKVARALVQRQIPFLFLTGSVQEVVPAEFQAVPLLFKPFEAERLFELLRDLLPAQMP